ncbi:Gti1/Pac2 family-domain-containing protein [Mycena amicta]|nr:Gti1/Pac2 family-domain-containing protein [Mycena amicta]
MQHPTCTGTHVRTPADAHIIFHAVSLGVLPMISRRLDTDERRAIQSGCIYIWEERGAANGTTEPMGLGIERWTDSIRWGPSRVREEFLFYHEREPDAIDIDLSYDSESASPLGYTPTHALLRENLIKQTYSVFVETAHGRRKWHLIAYFTQDSVDYLRTVEEIPQLACIRVPPGMYTSARRRPNPRPQPQQYQIPPPPPYAPPPAYVVYAPYPVPARYPAPPVTAPPLITASVSPPGFPLTSASPGTATPTRRTPSSSTHDLPPLEFLESMPPPCRHPLDEKALMSFPLKLGSTHQITPEFGRAQKGN